MSELGLGCAEACVQLGKWDIALKLLGTMERDGTQLATRLLRL